MKKKSIIFFCLTVIITAFITYCIDECIHMQRIDFNMLNAEVITSYHLDIVADAYKKEKYEIILYEIDKFNSFLTDSPYGQALSKTQISYYKTIITGIEYRIKKQHTGIDGNELKNTYDKLLSCIDELNKCYSNSDSPNKANLDLNKVDKLIDSHLDNNTLEQEFQSVLKDTTKIMSQLQSEAKQVPVSGCQI